VSIAIQFSYSSKRSVVAGWFLPAFGAIGFPRIEFKAQTWRTKNHPAATDQEYLPKTGWH
jgi:hypothetical protein